MEHHIEEVITKLRKAGAAGNAAAYHVNHAVEADVYKILKEFDENSYLEGHMAGSAFSPVEASEPKEGE